MSDNLLYVPLRTTTEKSLGEELKAIIKNDYFQSPSIFEAELSQITKIRKKVLQLKDEQVDKSKEIFLKQYYIQIANLTKKFSNECIEFQWYGNLGYKPSGPYKMRSLKFEQYNIIYQLGSLYSQLAVKESRFNDDGLKRAYRYFQLSAGCFESASEMIKKDPAFVGAGNYDLSEPTLQHLKYLMLSQAQETMWQKSVNSDMKNSVISRLSFETSNLYNKAVEYGNKSDFIKLEFVNFCSVKHYHFKSAAYYRLSLVDLDNLDYGKQVGHLKLAVSCGQKGLKYKNYVKQYVVDDLIGLVHMVEEAARVAERDNDLIYLKPVPDSTTLELDSSNSIGMVKPIVIEEISDPLSSDRLFLKDLLPYLIIQIALAYRDRQDTFIIKNLLEPLQSLNKMMNYFLTQRQLPASIDSLQKPENLPESIIQHSQDIIKNGGTQLIDHLYDNVLQLSSECRDIHEGCQQRLVIEAEEDELFRERYSEWTRIASKEATQDLWFKVNSMEEYLSQADKADDMILQSYHDIKEYLELYCGGYDSLIKYIPSSSYVKLSDETNVIVNDIREALDSTNEMELARKDFLKRLENKSKDNNILPKLISEYKLRLSAEFINDLNESSFEQVYHQHMRLFNEDLEFVESLKNMQIVLENKIDELNQLFLKKYSEEDGQNESSNERKESLQILEDIYSQYLQLISNIDDARKFYADFKTRGHKVLEECDGYVTKRREEARDLEYKLNQPASSHRVVTPLPVTPINESTAASKTSHDDNTNPQSKDIKTLQEQFSHTAIRKLP